MLRAFENQGETPATLDLAHRAASFSQQLALSQQPQMTLGDSSPSLAATSVSMPSSGVTSGQGFFSPAPVPPPGWPIAQSNANQQPTAAMLDLAKGPPGWSVAQSNANQQPTAAMLDLAKGPPGWSVAQSNANQQPTAAMLDLAKGPPGWSVAQSNTNQQPTAAMLDLANRAANSTQMSLAQPPMTFENSSTATTSASMPFTGIAGGQVYFPQQVPAQPGSVAPPNSNQHPTSLTQNNDQRQQHQMNFLFSMSQGTGGPAVLPAALTFLQHGTAMLMGAPQGSRPINPIPPQPQGPPLASIQYPQQNPLPPPPPQQTLSQDSQVAPPLIQPRALTNRPPVPLFLDFDQQMLTEYQCLVRQQIELFEVGPDDMQRSAQGRNKPIELGQVGIRCRHCAALPPKAQGRGSIYFTRTIDGVYQIAQNMAKKHLCDKCKAIPIDIKKKLTGLHGTSKTSRATGGREYWSECLRVLGVYEDNEILRFRA
jgi:hypothetical protein